MGRVALWGGIGFLVFFISQRPGAAGDVVLAITDMLVAVANGFADFATGLA
ncbi:MAG: hypothetical protein ACRDT8_14875 [Micromonosporaceae bacterium]